MFLLFLALDCIISFTVRRGRSAFRDSFTWERSALSWAASSSSSHTVQMKKYGCTLQICLLVLTRAMVKTPHRGRSTFSPWGFTARLWPSRCASEFFYFCTFSGGTLRTSRRWKKLRKKNISHISVILRTLPCGKLRNKPTRSHRNHRN